MRAPRPEKVVGIKVTVGKEMSLYTSWHHCLRLASFTAPLLGPPQLPGYAIIVMTIVLKNIYIFCYF